MRGATAALAAKAGQGYNFNPRAPCGARRLIWVSGGSVVVFQSTRPIRGATIHDADALPTGEQISIHAPHTGRDTIWTIMISVSLIFQSTRPIRGATKTDNDIRPGISISIHAPHTGRDTSRARHTAHNDKDFNPRAPYGARPQHGEKQRQHQEFQSTRPIRGATTINDILEGIVTFQSTRPIRGATNRRCKHRSVWGDFNPRAPYGARHQPSSPPPLPDLISIHAPHTGRDLDDTTKALLQSQFQSTRPIRGATPATGRADPTAKFQSTRPIRGATYGIIIYKDGEPVFQSTRPIRGATSHSSSNTRECLNFNPRAPYGARPPRILES